MKKIAVLMGGPSKERAISLKSGKAVAHALKRRGYDVVEIIDMEDVIEQLEELDIKIVFNALHGRFGEDGTIQKMLDQAGIAYTGCDERASQLAFNKKQTKLLLEELGLPTPSWGISKKNGRTCHLFNKGKLKSISMGEISSSIPFPLAIKPVDEGSSIDIKKIGNDFELESELKSFDMDREMLIEHWIEGRELTVGILKEKTLPVIEITTSRDFYDYKAKYESADTLYQVPALLSELHSSEIQSLALKTHLGLGCRDMSRVDFILDQDHKIWILEVNTIPGFTDSSLLPKAAQEIGIGFDDLCESLLKCAYERFVNLKL